jgi:hypothetical protein
VVVPRCRRCHSAGRLRRRRGPYSATCSGNAVRRDRSNPAIPYPEAKPLATTSNDPLLPQIVCGDVELSAIAPRQLQCDDRCVAEDGRHDDDQVRRIRRALFGRGELTRQDAELLQQERERLGWFGRPSRARTALFFGAQLFWIAVLVIGLVAGASMSRLTIPLIFVIPGLPLYILAVIRRGKIERALARPPT